MQQINKNNITIDKLELPVFFEKKVSVSVLRLDKIHPIISGNKWFKLRYYLEEAVKQNKKTIVTFGGAWSNHIVATAGASAINKLNCIGLIRGEEAENLSSTLIQAKLLGMKLIFLNRNDYKHKVIPSEINDSEHYYINEGGFGKKGALGAGTILSTGNFKNYTHLCCAAGTGTMAAGLLNGIIGLQKLIAISVLKNHVDMEEKIKEITNGDINKLTLDHNYHFGGYAKHKPELLQFMNNFYQQTLIPTDFVYTGKLCFAIMELVRKNYFLENSNILIIHSGGLQGNSSLRKGTLIF